MAKTKAKGNYRAFFFFSARVPGIFACAVLRETFLPILRLYIIETGDYTFNIRKLTVLLRRKAASRPAAFLFVRG
ncbi:MAG TPA: hypothetical protein VGA53_02350 [Candidatus Paceibacterota bacterium]